MPKKKLTGLRLGIARARRAMTDVGESDKPLQRPARRPRPMAGATPLPQNVLNRQITADSAYLGELAAEES